MSAVNGHEVNPAADSPDRPIGYGRIQRKEDQRFVRGKGTFTDDIVLPNMLHGAVLRAPMAHARLTYIDATHALALPHVRAVITGKDLEARDLAWMPTLSQDRQSVLVTDKVRFQGQEVAFVIADDRYTARDALELIDVDYEPLPAMVDVRKALDPGAPLVRDEMDGRTDNRIFDWEAGDAAETDAVFATAPTSSSSSRWSTRACTRRRWRPAASIADFDRGQRQAHVWVTTQAPHAHRMIYAPRPVCPSTSSGSSRPTSAAGSATRSPIYPGYLLAIVGSMMTGRPVKWMEDRSENLMSGIVRP